MSETEKLENMFTKDKVEYFHATWGPEGLKMSDEERAGFINKVLDDVAKDMAYTVSVPVSQLIEIVDALDKLVSLGQQSVEDWLKMPEAERNLRHEIFHLSEFPHMFAEQWLPEDVRKERRLNTVYDRNI